MGSRESDGGGEGTARVWPLWGRPVNCGAANETVKTGGSSA